MNMRYAFARHLFAILALPFTMAVIIPAVITRRGFGDPIAGANLPRTVELVLGVVFGSIGLALFVSTVRLFGAVGDGTLAPWDPPRHLVVRGPYRYVRNPMISGVICLLLAEALVADSRRLLLWAGTFFLINAIYIPLSEEPMLRARFGASYDEYCRNVRRLIPRFRPWQSSGGQE